MIRSTTRQMIAWFAAAILAMATGVATADEPDDDDPPPPPENVPHWNEAPQGASISNVYPISNEAYDEYPVIAKSADGRLWIAYKAGSGDNDRIALTSFDESSVGFVKAIEGGKEHQDLKDVNLSPPMIISEGTGVEWRPVVAVSVETLWVAWCGKRSGRWDVYVRSVNTETRQMGPEERVTTGERPGYKPAACVDSHGQLWVVWESRDGNGLDLFARVRGKEGWGDILTVSDAPGRDFRPSICAGRPGEVWIAWDRQEKESYDIFLRRFEDTTGGPEIRMTNHPAQDSCASVTWHDGKLWIAWHSDRIGTNQWGLTKWIYVRAFDGENWYEPVAEMKDKDLFKSGTDQAYEFPTIHFDSKGRLIVFGRPSHNFDMQDLDGNEWSRRIRLPNEGWGGRGQYMSAVETQPGVFWTVRRDLRTNMLERIECKDYRERVEPVLKRIEPENFTSPLQVP
ncbi:MAG: hypothetical protein V2A74_08520, partial [bacterium]